jgi:PAS domain-containing protein
MSQNFEAMYEELLQFLYRTPWGLIQTARNGDIQMLNPVSAKLLMPLAFNGRLDNLFDLLRNGRPELQALVAATTERYCVVCEDLPLPALHQPAVGAGGMASSVSISIFVQNQDMLMVVLRESHILQRPANPSQAAELNALQNLPQLGLIKTRNAVISWSNPAAQRMLGYSGKQLLNAPFTDLFAQGVGELLLDSCLPKLMAGASYSERLTLLPGSAATLTLDVSASSTSFAQEEILWTLMVPGAQPPAAQAQGRTPMEHRESL